MPLLRPAGRRVLPRLLPSVHGEIHECVAVVHHLYATTGGPVGLEDAVAVSEVAHEVHQADVASDEERVQGGLCGVPRHVPAHEVAVTAALVVGALTEDCVRDVAGMQVRQLCDLGGGPGATFALLGRRSAVVPHEGSSR